MYKLCFYVPESHLDAVKNALFEAGAGSCQDYDQCCWQILGEGQFRPLPGSQPYLGSSHVLHKLPEYKVEMICRANAVKAAVGALLRVHPYHRPAYEVYKILTPADL